MGLRTALIAGLLLFALPAAAQNPPAAAVPPAPAVPAPNAPAAQTQAAPAVAAPAAPPAQVAPRPPALALAATFGSGATIPSGLKWRIFAEQAQPDGSRPLIAQSSQATPILTVPPGVYLVHVAYGLAGATREVSVGAEGATSERIPLNAGVLRVTGVLGDATIPPNRLAVDVYVPQPGNFEAKLVVKGAKSGAAIGLPEGVYHVVSTYLETSARSANQPNGGTLTNAVVSADLRVRTGQLTDARLRQHAAVLTLKLVHKAGGEALANTIFTVLTPGGDIIRELIGAFPSLVLAEGDYVVIARRNGKTYQSKFSVQSGVDRDIEVLAK
ncbi:MAG TPA: hypothetical protein VMU56_04115 [Beijerinckiaceae bacterium]|nr:hypothetical protein [Beijerinckiaceae bacterium]